MLNNLHNNRGALSRWEAIDQGIDDEKEFWKSIGGKKPKSIPATSGEKSETAPEGVKRLLRLSDDGGSLQMTEVTRRR